MSRLARIAAFFVAATVAATPAVAAAAPSTCDPIGRFQLRVVWGDGKCQALPGNEEPLDVRVVKSAAGEYRLAPQEGVVAQTISVSDAGGTCRFVIDQAVNQTAYGEPDLAHWRLSFDVRGDVATGSGTFDHVEGSRRSRKCVQKLTLSGARVPVEPSTDPSVERAPVKPVNKERSPEQLAETFSRFVTARRPEVEACWIKAHPDYKGKQAWLRMHLVILRSGEVSKADFVEDTLQEPAVSACALGMARGWTFPSPDVEQAEYTHAFAFPAMPPGPPPKPAAPPSPAAPPPPAADRAGK